MTEFPLLEIVQRVEEIAAEKERQEIVEERVVPTIEEEVAPKEFICVVDYATMLNCFFGAATPTEAFVKSKRTTTGVFKTAFKHMNTPIYIDENNQDFLSLTDLLVFVGLQSEITDRRFRDGILSYSLLDTDVIVKAAVQLTTATRSVATVVLDKYDVDMVDILSNSIAAEFFEKPSVSRRMKVEHAQQTAGSSTPGRLLSNVSSTNIRPTINWFITRYQQITGDYRFWVFGVPSASEQKAVVENTILANDKRHSIAVLFCTANSTSNAGEIGRWCNKAEHSILQLFSSISQPIANNSYVNYDRALPKIDIATGSPIALNNEDAIVTTIDLLRFRQSPAYCLGILYTLIELLIQDKDMLNQLRNELIGKVTALQLEQFQVDFQKAAKIEKVSANKKLEKLSTKFADYYSKLMDVIHTAEMNEAKTTGIVETVTKLAEANHFFILRNIHYLDIPGAVLYKGLGLHLQTRPFLYKDRGYNANNQNHFLLPAYDVFIPLPTGGISSIAKHMGSNSEPIFVMSPTPDFNDIIKYANSRLNMLGGLRHPHISESINTMSHGLSDKLRILTGNPNFRFSSACLGERATKYLIIYAKNLDWNNYVLTIVRWIYECINQNDGWGKRVAYLPVTKEINSLTINPKAPESNIWLDYDEIWSDTSFKMVENTSGNAKFNLHYPTLKDGNIEFMDLEFSKYIQP
jgi:hypothetical protein